MIITRPITANHGSYDRKQSIQQATGTLKPGQIIDALTLNNSSHGQVSLRIGTITLKASTNISLQQNLHLSLEVVQTQPSLLLRLIPSSVELTTTRPLQEAKINLLPRQTGLAPALAELIHRTMIKGDLPRQQTIYTLVHTLINNLPTRGMLVSAEGLRQAIFQSGLYLEAMLPGSSATKRERVSRDLKACLLRIRHSLEQEIQRLSLNNDRSNKAVTGTKGMVPPPRRMNLPLAQPRALFSLMPDANDTNPSRPGLFNSIQGAIARLGLLQVATAENFNNGEYMWQLEIPVRHADAVEIVSMTIEKEQNDTLNEDNNSWVINLAMDLPRLGAIEIRISMYKQGVSSHFWSDSPDIIALIEGQFTQLRTNLKRHGVETLNLGCQAGKPAVTEQINTNTSNIDLQV